MRSVYRIKDLAVARDRLTGLPPRGHPGKTQLSTKTVDNPVQKFLI
jgi:hypothetical protein